MGGKSTEVVILVVKARANPGLPDCSPNKFVLTLNACLNFLEDLSFPDFTLFPTLSMSMSIVWKK